MNKKMKPKIGFIGQGWIGKHYADDFEKRGFSVVRYAKEESYAGNKKDIAKCDIVFIAVPTPTTPKGFDYSIVQSVLSLVGKGKIAVIKSSLLPGTTEELQKKHSRISIVHSPEFLREVSASYDAQNPQRNIVGIPKNSKKYKDIGKMILSILPKAPYGLVCSSKEAELIKYAGNCFLFTKVVFANILYDISKRLGLSWQVIEGAVSADPRIGKSHMNPIHASGRGAGGHCFLKDFAAFSTFYKKNVKDIRGIAVLQKLEEKNIELLMKSGKNLDLLKEVHGL